ncbi:UMP-CMP kinase [Salix suchowensis]|nr:UMP-CMP kinase [Salix suchowensis]
MRCAPNIAAIVKTNPENQESDWFRHSSSLMESPGEFPTQKDTSKNFSHEASVVFVLGGPASGKGTQCPKIVEHFGFTHLCAGELLEEETKSGSENGKMIRNFKLEGKIVPSEVTVGILQQAMQQSENKKFIIDGFPRNEENLATFEKTVKVEPEFISLLLLLSFNSSL